MHCNIPEQPNIQFNCETKLEAAMFKVFLTCCLIAAVVCAPVEDEIEGDGDEPVDFGTLRIQKMDAKNLNIGGAFYIMRKVGNEISVRWTLTLIVFRLPTKLFSNSSKSPSPTHLENRS